MDERKKAYKDLVKKKIGELRKIAGRFEPPIELKPSWTRDKIAKLIMARRIDPVVQKIATKIQEHIEKNPVKQQKQPVNPEFEKAVAEPVTERRGGVREGAGRPMGMTDEKAKVKNLPQYPSNPIKHSGDLLFNFWAKTARIEELALTEEEAILWSLPATQLQEYYYPGAVPEIAGAWIELIYSVLRILGPRFDMISAVRKQRREAGVKSSFIDRTPRHYKYNDGQGNLKPLHAVPAGEPAAYTENMDDVTCQTCLEVIEKARP